MLPFEAIYNNNSWPKRRERMEMVNISEMELSDILDKSARSIEYYRLLVLTCIEMTR